MKRMLVVLLMLASLGAGAVAQTTPSSVATPTPLVSGGAALIKYSGQILDYRNGFIFFTTGDGYHTAPNVRVIDAATGRPTTQVPATRTYARVAFDGAGTVVEIALSKRPLPQEAGYDAVRGYAVVQSPRKANPDFSKNKAAIEGKPVLVTFIVTVPPTTPLTDTIYIATDKSGWLPNAIKMDRIDALRYRYTQKLNSGTELNYLFTRGTWTTVERGQNGLEQPPHHIFVQNLDTENRSNQVFYWADQGTSGGAPNAQATFNPAALPTPYNPSPFNFPSPHPFPTKTP